MRVRMESRPCEEPAPYKADIRVECFERLLSSESGHTIKSFEQSASDPKRTLNNETKYH